MKSIFDKDVRAEIIQRIDSLNKNAHPSWGKMTLAQMARHCSICENYYLGNVKVSRSFLGRVIGQAAIKGLLKDESTTLGKNAPTSPTFKVSENITDAAAELAKWKSLIHQYADFDNDYFVHWFFGKMTKAQLGQFVYKHCDHHLRQFGV